MSDSTRNRLAELLVSLLLLLPRGADTLVLASGHFGGAPSTEGWPLPVIGSVGADRSPAGFVAGVDCPGFPG
jgi:hypothetical protein